MNSFIPFGPEHWISVIIILVISVACPLFISRHVSEAGRRRMEVALACCIILLKITEPFYLVYSGKRWETSLPLQLCDLGALLTAALLLKRNLLSYELTYFWGLGGTLQALLTPNLKHGFPSVEFWLFFVSHGVVILGALYGTLVFKLRPTLRSIGRVGLVTAAVAAVIAVINLLLNTNYLFLCRKPSAASLLDYLGPWPYYIPMLVPVALITFLVYYSPFLVIDWFNRRRNGMAS